MAHRKRHTRFLKETSDQSGFDNFDYWGKKKAELIRHEGRLIFPDGDELDVPAPSKIPLGGADISGDPRANSLFTTVNVASIPTTSQRTTVYVNSSRSISWVSSEPWTVIVGSNQTQVMSVNPQITAGQQAQILGLECVGSSVTLISGSGITIDIGLSRVLLDSGGIATLIYNATDSTWHITSYSQNAGFAI